MLLSIDLGRNKRSPQTQASSQRSRINIIVSRLTALPENVMPKYFEPRKLEQWRGRSIYEFLGVRFFKRYLLPTELLLLRLSGKKAIQGGQGVLKAELKRLEWETRRNEVIHLLALLLTGCIFVFKSPQLSIAQFLGVFAINLYVNVYPIFLQRYNRFRIMRLLGEYKL
jgi:glycosyl-4,4'-diaponeurosporenoate acyltransferase